MRELNPSHRLDTFQLLLVSKREFVTFFQEHGHKASASFLSSNSLGGKVENVMKRHRKDSLIKLYGDFYDKLEIKERIEEALTAERARKALQFSSIFKQTENPCSIVKMKVNILLVGSSGQGKSTFGNFLANEPTTQFKKELFKEGDDMDSCTAECEMIRLYFHDSEEEGCLELNIIDTPGLNDTDPKKEVSNMSAIASLISELGTLTCAIVCSSFDSKANTQYRDTIRYYSRLLDPLVQRDRVIVVGTKLDEDTYDKWSEKDLFEKKKTALMNRISELMDHRIAHCYFLESKIPEDELQDAFKCFLDSDGPQTTYSNSLDARDKILMTIVQWKGISMLNNVFPLPPVIEDRREVRMKFLDEKIHGIEHTLREENSKHAELARIFCSLQTESNELTKVVAKLHSARTILSNEKLCTQMETFSGGGVFFGQSQTVVLNCVIPEFTVVYQQWKATLTRLDHDDPCQAKFLIKPDVFHAKRWEGCRWYVNVHLEYDGRIANRIKIQELHDRINKNVERLDEISEQLLVFDEKIKRSADDSAKLARVFRNLQLECNLLNRQYFSLHEMPEIASMLEMEDAPTLSSE
eukprot:Lithocolla_globosa_v1_NODE_161_length_5591_cov_403.883192.p2 type:complete len:582 gc:universal NODE_161_length_5591_cov_403.883192:1815-70(-)